MDKDVRLMLAIHIIWSHVLHGGCNDMHADTKKGGNKQPDLPGWDWSLDLEAKQNRSG